MIFIVHSGFRPLNKDAIKIVQNCGSNVAVRSSDEQLVIISRSFKHLFTLFIYFQKGYRPPLFPLPLFLWYFLMTFYIILKPRIMMQSIDILTLSSAFNLRCILSVSHSS